MVSASQKSGPFDKMLLCRREALSTLLTLIQKRYPSSAKQCHMLYKSAAEAAALLQEGVSKALTDDEL